ncbi:T9SS type A sorting domain-containing protein [Polaribacter pectinis]|uniref:T9SS type A sorting domain-containing protein n=1 Tax=Polaribacter pectinis TaxID=2738844 RepID=A0A7G9LE70_9FLAO|nr:T9SS type A sorting domain-containing protein [Polaribacter pectinis]QNM86919.1 T9SS type A sorting domain-containing protein [Polaribacter pectinis]
MIKKTCYLIFFIFSNLYSQVNFTNGETLLDLTHYSSDISALAAADLNNDGYKEIIVGSYYDNTIMFYKNINGDIQYFQRQLLIQNPNTNYYSDFDIYCEDVDSDGLIDIAVTHSNSGKISWYKNLGDYNFDGERAIAVINKPKSLVVGDIDNDGDNDFIVGSEDVDKITLLLNNSLAVFNEQVIISNTNYAVNKVKLYDLDKNGYLDVIGGQENGNIYWSKNIDGVNFSSAQFITGAADDGYGFDFLDVNGDSYDDIIFSSNYDDNLKYLLNINGNSFSSESIIDSSLSDPYNLLVKDFDHDGLKDIIVSTTSDDKIGWYKNNNGSFSSIIQITNNVNNPKYFLIEDLDNDNSLEIITSSYQSNESGGQKLSVFKKSPTSSSYEENIINFHFSAANAVQIADLDNDGNNDIISAFKSIVWNKNHGNDVFSSQYLISQNINNLFTLDVEVKDLNNDGWLDIIGITGGNLEIYKNMNGENFIPIHTQVIDEEGEDIEISDVNNDGYFDILISHRNGETPISKVINNGNFDFQSITPIYTFGGTGYKAYNFKCGDVDKDGYIDIVVGASDVSEIHWLKNDGNGNFTYQYIVSSIACNKIDIGDLDNDGNIDIIAAGNYSYGNSDLNWLENNSEGFSSPTKIDTQSLKSITLGDIDNDGFLDIVGTSYEYYSPYDERILYYLFKDGSFESQMTIESLGDALSLTKDAVLGDLNNDNKLDIVSSYYFINSVKYFMNSSTLSLEDINLTNSRNFKIYPNPSIEFIYWNKNLNISNISIFNSIGKLMYRNDKKITIDKLNVSFIPKGLYFIVAKSDQSIYTTKLIIK